MEKVVSRALATFGVLLLSTCLYCIPETRSKAASDDQANKSTQHSGVLIIGGSLRNSRKFLNRIALVASFLATACVRAALSRHDSSSRRLFPPAFLNV